MNAAPAAASQIPTEIHAKSNIVNMVENMQHGVPPTNAQINKELDATKQYLAPQVQASTSAKEEKVLTDAVKLVEAAQTTLEMKNKDEKIQQLATAIATTKSAEFDSTPLELREQVNEFLDGLKQMTMLFINSADYRKAISELLNLVKTMLDIGSDQVKPNTGSGKDVKDITLNQAVDAVQEVANNVKNLDTKQIPEERKREFKQQLKAFLQSLNNEGIREGLEGFLSMWNAVSSSMFSKIERVRVNSDINRVGATAKAVVEEFTGQKPLDDWLVCVRYCMDKAANDPELQYFLDDVREYFANVIEKPELVESDHFYDKGNELLERGRTIMEKYRNDDMFIGIFEKARMLSEEIKNDDALNLLKNRSTEFFGNFVYSDAANNSRLDLEMIDKLRANLVPFLATLIKEIPLRRVEIKDKDYEWLIFDDLRLCMDEKLLPEQIKLHFENYTDLSVRSDDPSTSTTRVSFSVANLKPKFENFYFSMKKISTPAIQDEGRMSARVRGNGLSIRGRFILSRDPKTGAILSDHKINVHIDRLQIDILQAKHDVLLTLGTMFFGNYIKQKTEEVVRESLTTTILGYGDVLNAQVFSKLPTVEGLAQQGIEAVKSGIPV
jgi:hypothetical protein